MNTEIPRVFHRIWIGREPMPADHERWAQHCAELHPEWTHRLWGNARLLSILPDHLAEIWAKLNPANKSDLGGYLLVYRFGGVYCDTDFTWHRPIDPLLYCCEAFCVQTDGGQASGAVFGGRPGHPAWEAVLDALPAAFDPNDQLSIASKLLTRVFAGRADIRRLERRTFIPVPYGQRHRLAKMEEFPGSVAVHRFAASWVPEPGN